MGTVNMMRFSTLILLISLLQCGYGAKGATEEKLNFSDKTMGLDSKASAIFFQSEQISLFKNRPSPLFRKFHDKQKRNQKITAAVLAFPFPFGIVGLHRIYLGCPPYVPVVYIGTLGGVFGVLPLIDFFVIVIDKNTENYVNNQQVFMWVK